ncbi:retropepsin-like aspartic protease family protein [Thalassotalea atypica]|uniref:retropepsin-like aspartic protease family protein n=1 Tax=Thalassotalea atypica TaxID=2054316 RepID=UPI0025725B0C|nr:TIGR02281 family clan AA aspartic protease [Thalassotalea atypica]
MTENDSSNNFGKLFIWLAWIIAICLLVFVFNDVLEKQWNPNQSPESYLSVQGKNQVILKQNKNGHYVSNGTINNSNVLFLLDTGATQVSIPLQVADKLKLESFGSYPVQTANGQVYVTRTKIDTLSIGDIVLHDVAAHINPGMKSDEILLGMSALKRVEFRQTGRQLILTEQ